VTGIRIKVAFRTCRRREVPTTQPRSTGPTAIARRIALAHHVEALIASGEVLNLGAAAERLGVTPARMTQIGDLALLAPDIQAAVLLGHCEPRDRHLRAVGRHALWTDQRAAFHSLFPNVLLENQTDDDD
jgi:hypothetical protein